MAERPVVRRKTVKDRMLTDLGDTGADTFQRYFAQIEYTAFWCSRMLVPAEQILRVVPETYEDVLIDRHYGVSELHQVKTRQQNQRAWSWSDLVPVLAEMYSRGEALRRPFEYVFCSNHPADDRLSRNFRDVAVSPFRFKSLLDALRDYGDLTTDEHILLDSAVNNLTPLILRSAPALTSDVVQRCLKATILDSGSVSVRAPNVMSDFSGDNITNLSSALSDISGSPPTLLSARETYRRLLMLIMSKIVTGKTEAEREIVVADVLACQSQPVSGKGVPQLDSVEGDSLLHKKAILGGFDPTEVPSFRRQRMLAEEQIRRFSELGLGDIVDRLTTSLLDVQQETRDRVCRVLSTRLPGPDILRVLRPELRTILATYKPELPSLDASICLGILWRETDSCSAWWHDLKAVA